MNLHAPGRQKTKSTSQEKSETKKEANSCSWERNDQQLMGTRKQIHESLFEDLILTKFLFYFCFAYNMNDRDNVKFYLSPLTRHHREIWES